MAGEFTEQLTEALSVYDYTPPQAVSNASINTGGFDMTKFRRVMWVITAGSMGAAGTLDGRIQTSVNSNFVGAANLASTNITQIVANNLCVSVEIRADQIPANARYIRLNLTGGGNAITIGAVGLGGCSSFKPAKQFDNTSVITQRLVYAGP